MGLENRDDIIFAPKINLKSVFGIFGFIWALAIFVSWDYIVDRNMFGIGAVALILGVITIPNMLKIREKASQRIIFKQNEMVLLSIKSSETVDFNDVLKLEKRSVKLKRGLYKTGYFAVLKGDRQILFFMEGYYPNEDQLIKTISERIKRQWVEA